MAAATESVADPGAEQISRFVAGIQFSVPVSGRIPGFPSGNPGAENLPEFLRIQVRETDFSIGSGQQELSPQVEEVPPPP